jgi:hypothetical protein
MAGKDELRKSTGDGWCNRANRVNDLGDGSFIFLALIVLGLGIALINFVV